MEALLAELPEYAQRVAIVAVETGMRRGELQRLQWNDVDFEQRTIKVRHTKNGEFRVLYMTDRLHDTLQAQKQKGIIPAVLVGQDTKPFVDLKKSLATAGKKAGIGHVHLHMLRHSFATRLREKGAPLSSIMQALGHKSLDMTLRYAQATPTELRSAFELLNAPEKASREEQETG